MYIYFGCINLLSFIIRGRDKWMAAKKKWRVSEKQLLFLSLLGGFVGAYLAMHLFRHKTLKSNFLWKFRAIVAIWIGIIIIAISTQHTINY